MKKFRNHNILPVLVLILLASIPVNGQQSNTFYLMHDVPQSNLLNPAVQLSCRYFIGIPGLASTHISYSNTAFTYNDLAGTENWNIEGVLRQMHRVDLLAMEVYLHPVSLGYRHKTLYFTFNIAEKIQAFQLLPKDLSETLIHGNGPFVGETARFNALRSAVSYQREYSLGLSKLVDSRWTLGARAKLLFGKANIFTGRSRLGITTSENNFDISLYGDYEMNISFPLTLTQDANGIINGGELGEMNPVQLILNRGNPGFALDLGAIYRYDEKLTLSASLLDIGLIRWRTDLNNIRGSGDFIFQGAEPGTDIISGDFLTEMSDSLLNALDITLSQDPYTSFLPAQLFLGGSYRVKDNLALGAVNRNLIFRNKIHSSLTLSASADVADRFLATLSWSYLNNSVNNIGAGLAYHGKGFQFHVVSDNLLGFFYPFNTRSVNFRTGFNLMFGCPKNKREVLEGESYGSTPKGGDCSWTGHQKIRKKYQKKTRRRK
ncbi:MAG: hypothetical protein KAT15_24705 [Bacteroidales bacterium]|nr:hypothetical protein [Bacteroidales bacterium]